MLPVPPHPRSDSRAHARRMPRALLGVGLLVLAACSSDAIIGIPVDSRNQVVTAAVGQEIDVTLGNVGPGTYVSPPSISSNVVTFVDMLIVPPSTPDGPTQRFRFRTVAKGQAIIGFQRTLNDSVLAVVEDTVVVH